MARETVPELVEPPSSNLCVTSIGAAIFMLMLNHADIIGDQSDAVTQNAWFCCVLCAAISGEISILLQNGAESWGRFPVPRICSWESIVSCDHNGNKLRTAHYLYYKHLKTPASKVLCKRSRPFMCLYEQSLV